MPSKQKIASVVGMLCEAFNRKPSAVVFMAYEVGLAGLSDEQVDAAANAVLTGGYEFMPPPGQLRALALTNGIGLDAQADRAWSVLCRAIDQFGSGRSVNFRDALINATVRFLGGWEFICQRPVEEFEKWTKKDFCAAYSRFMQSGPPAELRGYLIGTNERTNVPWIGSEFGCGGKAYELPAPVEVGCDYEPLLLSAANQQPALNQRPANVPRLQLRKVEA